MEVVISAPILGAIPRNFTLTATPYAAGSLPVVTTDLGPVLHVGNLSPGLLYKLSATATLPGGRVVPVSESQFGMRDVSGPKPSAPFSIALVTPTGPTSARVAMRVSGTPPPTYIAYFTAADRVSPGIHGKCAEPSSCLVQGLQPDTTYTVLAVGVLSDGSLVPAEGVASITTPTDGTEGLQPSPTISSATRRGSKGSVLISWLGSGPRPARYVVFVSPLSDEMPLSDKAGPMQTCLSRGSSTTCPFSDLRPSTDYLVSCAAAPPSLND